ncbi:hypothetical protein [Mucilaginibacter antarcticus]|uniref:hypothetical protein n=1 Tax=Mucilaginibacter antarcticus TaxID=1855725 RepID=UPI003630C50B
MAQPVTQIYRRANFGNNIRFEVEPIRFDPLLSEGDAGYYFPDDKVEKAFEINGQGFNGRLKSSIMLGVKLNPKLSNYNLSAINYGAKNYPAFRISDGSAATLIALGIIQSNVANYRYRIVLNDSLEVVHWSPVKLSQIYGQKQPHGFLGRFNYPDKQVLIEVVNTNNYNDRDGVVFDWRESLKPYITGFSIGAPPLAEADSLRGLRKSLAFDNDHDSITKMVSNLSFIQGGVGIIRLSVQHHSGIPYDVALFEKTAMS